MKLLMAQTDGSLMQTDDIQSINNLAQADWFMLHTQPMSLLLYI